MRIIMYSSITGNTEKVAHVFADVLKAHNFNTALEKVHPQRDYVKEPIYFDDCDLLCLGAPIIAALPYRELSSVIGWSGKHVELFKGPRPDLSRPGRLRAGCCFFHLWGYGGRPKRVYPHSGTGEGIFAALWLYAGGPVCLPGKTTAPRAGG